MTANPTESANTHGSMHETLHRVFGFTGFRPNQEAIVAALLERRDVFAVMPTGGGKSLCYQLPAIMAPGTGIVFSPLISLMKDQVDAAQAYGIRAAYINSSQRREEARTAWRRARAGELDLLYIAPERFAMEGFLQLLNDMPLALFAIDEAHCISEWGHDFRPDYLNLSTLVERFPDVPLAAFTATATPRVQSDIITRLGLRDPMNIRASFDRPNLFYQVASKGTVDRQILSFLGERKGEPGIVYRTTRSDVEDTAEFLCSQGIKALAYHAGMDNQARHDAQEAFSRDEVDVVVATIAFGMGIDKSNIRFVIHGDLPKNIEGYYQETGRAGRDGEPSHCLLLYGPGDIPRLQYFIEKIEDMQEQKRVWQKLRAMITYASTHACRRRQLLSYFGEEYSPENCGTCDVCTGDKKLVDASRDAQMIMSAMVRTGQRFGAGHVIEVVCGAQTERIRRFRHDSLPTYGVGKGKSRKHWRSVIDHLIAHQFLAKTDDQYPVLRLTGEGAELLRGRRTFEMPAVIEEKVTRRVVTVQADEDPGLFQRLREVRLSLARRQGVPPYVVFSDATLHDMCRRLPTCEAEMLGVNGVGQKKLDRYGAAFIAAIAAHAGGEERG